MSDDGILMPHNPSCKGQEVDGKWSPTCNLCNGWGFIGTWNGKLNWQKNAERGSIICPGEKNANTLKDLL